MFNNFIEYQQAYFKQLYNVTDLDFGYFTQSEDLSYINSNSIIVTEVTDDAVASVCALLATDIHTTKIQFARNLIEFGDEDDTLYLVSYNRKDEHQSDMQLSIELVTADNYQQFLELSNQLQIQEYGELYKQQANCQYLQQSVYQMYMIKHEGRYVGEFIYLPKLQAVESLIVLKAFQRQGIASAVLQLLATKFGTIYLSADESSINFYKRINAQIVDQYPVKNLYGNSRNLLMYISLCI